MVKLLGKIELVLGLLIISYASYLMIEFTLNTAYDPHGYLLIIAIFGTGIGGLMSFAGTVCIFSSKYKILSQIPLIIYTIIAIYTFGNAYV